MPERTAQPATQPETPNPFPATDAPAPAAQVKPPEPEPAPPAEPAAEPPPGPTESELINIEALDAEVKAGQLPPPVSEEPPKPAEAKPEEPPAEPPAEEPPAPSTEEPPAEPPTDRPDWGILDTELGELDDVEELKLDEYYKDIKPEHIKEMPVVAKQIVHNIRRHHLMELAEIGKEVEGLKTELDAGWDDLKRRETEFAQRQAEFAAVLDSPEVQKHMKGPEGELPDAYTEEGLQARIDKGVTDRIKGIFDPFRQEAETLRRQSSYRDFVESHPEMREPSFQGRVSTLVKERRDTGRPITTQDAYRLVKLEDLETEQQQIMAQQRTARAESARHVARTTTSGTPATTEIPKEIRKDAVKVYEFLQQNPEAKRAIDSSR